MDADAPALHTRLVDIADLKLDPENARLHDKRNCDTIGESLTRYRQRKNIVVNQRTMTVEAGNGTVRAALEAGYTQIVAAFVDDDEETAAGYSVADNRTADLATWDIEVLTTKVEAFPDVDWGAIGFGADDLASLASDGGGAEPPSADPPDVQPKLVDTFGVPPFSVLDARQGYWQNRKREWLALGINSEEGRSGALTHGSENKDPVSMKHLAVNGGTSIFDPVLAEVLVRWFSPTNGHVLDPFAGGSVRGVVATKLKRKYTGIELRPEQVEANRAQAVDIGVGPTWVCGDSLVELDGLKPGFDMILSCPPYYDLEVYSDRKEDISALKTYEEFLVAYREIIAKSVALLAEDSFACFVVGDMRDDRGFYRNFVADTIRAFESSDARLWNHAILVTALGTTAMRAATPMIANRKIANAHQHVLVFYRGDPKKIRARMGELDSAADLPQPSPISIGRGEVEVECNDALVYLRGVSDVPAVITSLPDPEEVGMGVDDWRLFIGRACEAIAHAMADRSVVFFYQTDRKIDGEVLDKMHVISSALYERGFRKVLDKTVLRTGVNKTSLFRPGFTKLAGFSRTLRTGKATPDTIEAGDMAYKNAMGMNAVGACLDYIEAKLPDADYVLDPFCGHGSVLWAATERGLGAVGVDLDPSACERARAALSG